MHASARKTNANKNTHSHTTHSIALYLQNSWINVNTFAKKRAAHTHTPFRLMASFQWIYVDKNDTHYYECVMCVDFKKQTPIRIRRKYIGKKFRFGFCIGSIWYSYWKFGLNGLNFLCCGYTTGIFIVFPYMVLMFHYVCAVQQIYFFLVIFWIKIY